MKHEPKYPAYDRVRDGNVFKWLLVAAEALRGQRIEAKRREFERLIELKRDDEPRRSNRK